jgi:antitoxin ParD1/3/4
MSIISCLSLADEENAFAKTLVEAGRFASMSAVLQQGAKLQRQQMEAGRLARATLKEVSDNGGWP